MYSIVSSLSLFLSRYTRTLARIFLISSTSLLLSELNLDRIFVGAPRDVVELAEDL